VVGFAFPMSAILWVFNFGNSGDFGNFGNLSRDPTFIGPNLATTSENPAT